VEQTKLGFTLQNVVLEFVTAHLIEQVAQEMTLREPLLLHYHALLLVNARQYVRESQMRQVLRPLLDRLTTAIGSERVEANLLAVLASLRQMQMRSPSYAAGNILNLSVGHMGHLRGQDFSGLFVRQGSFQGVDAQDANFCKAHFDKCDSSTAFQAALTVGFTPDGDYLVVGSDEGVHCIRRPQDNHEVQIRMETGHSVWQVCCSPDGRLIAAAGVDSKVYVWAIREGLTVHAFAGHVGAVWSVCFSPDNKLIASGGADGTVRIWDVQSKQCVITLSGHGQGVRDLCFSPAGNLLAFASEDGTVRLWENPGQPDAVRHVRTLRQHIGMVWTVAFSPDGALLASAGHDQTIRLWM
jgi:WD40 repeat protein